MNFDKKYSIQAIAFGYNDTLKKFNKLDGIIYSFRKNEIIKIAQDIDTFDLSIMPFEDCCTIFAPPAPKTKPRIDKARYYEERLDVDALVQRALDGIEITEIKIGDTFLNQEKKVFAELL